MSEKEQLGGKPEHKPTEAQRKLVRDMYAAGVPQSRLADHLDINEITLRKHYRAELDLNMDGMTTALGSNLYQDALSGDKQAREFWLKTRGRWSYAKPEEDKKSTTDTLLEKLIDKL